MKTHEDIDPQDYEMAADILASYPEPEAEIIPDTGFWTVAPFHVSREYGGPEEGGWWYDAGTPLAGPEFPLPVVTKSIREARDAEEAMQATLEALNKAHGNRPRYSVLSSGEYEARIIDGYPEPFPQERPMYC